MKTQSTARSSGPSLMPMITGAWASQAICVAATLGLADLLAQEHQSEEALAHATGTQPAALARLLRALASLGVFRETEQGLFASTPLGDQLRSEVSGSLRNLAMMVGAPEARRAWSDLTYSVRTGNSAFQNIFGMDTYEYRTRPTGGKGGFQCGDGGHDPPSGCGRCRGVRFQPLPLHCRRRWRQRCTAGEPACHHTGPQRDTF